MSYSHTQRRKTIRKFKKEHGTSWYKQFRLYVKRIVEKKSGKLLGSLEDLNIKGALK